MSGMPGAPAQAGDAAQVDTAEQVYISSLALLKMLKHGARASLFARFFVTLTPRKPLARDRRDRARWTRCID